MAFTAYKIMLTQLVKWYKKQCGTVPKGCNKGEYIYNSIREKEECRTTVVTIGLEQTYFPGIKKGYEIFIGLNIKCIFWFISYHLVCHTVHCIMCFHTKARFTNTNVVKLNWYFPFYRTTTTLSCYVQASKAMQTSITYVVPY